MYKDGANGGLEVARFFYISYYATYHPRNCIAVLCVYESHLPLRVRPPIHRGIVSAIFA